MVLLVLFCFVSVGTPNVGVQRCFLPALPTSYLDAVCLATSVLGTKQEKTAGDPAVGFVLHCLALSRFPRLPFLGALLCTHSVILWRVTSSPCLRKGSCLWAQQRERSLLLPMPFVSFCFLLPASSLLLPNCCSVCFSLWPGTIKSCLFGALWGKLLLLLSPLMSSASAFLVLLGRLPPIHLRSNLHY